MPPKNKPNAFIAYAQSIKQQLIREGHTINGMPDLVAAAGPYWKVSVEDFLCNCGEQKLGIKL